MKSRAVPKGAVYEPVGYVAAGGRKLTGEFSLVRMKKGTGREWLLIRKVNSEGRSSADML